jgi:hypothetical protein
MLEFKLTQGDSIVHLRVADLERGTATYQFHLVPDLDIKHFGPRDSANGAAFLITMLKAGYKFEQGTPELVINALIEPARTLASQAPYSRYNSLNADLLVDNNHWDDSESYYHIPPCDCNAPLVETSCEYFGEDDTPIYRTLIHLPTSNQIIDQNGNVVRQYRHGPEVCPNRKNDDGPDYYDDLNLICAKCGANI